MSDGITCVTEAKINDAGHCIVLTRNLKPEQLVRRLLKDNPTFLPAATSADLT